MTGHKQPLRWAELTEVASDLSSTQLGTVNARIRAFNASNNGVAAWAVALFFFDEGAEIPNDIRAYLSRVARELTALREIPDANKNNSASTEVPNIVLRTHGGGGRSVFSEYQDLLRVFPDAAVKTQHTGDHRVEPKRWPPVEAPLDKAIELNELIAELNNSNNAIVAWAVLGSLLDSRQPIPSEVSAYFSEISGDIVALAASPAVARKKVAKVVLRTTNRGGPASFRRRDTHRTQEQVVRQFRAIWAEERDIEWAESNPGGAKLERSSITAIYEKVAEANKMRPERVKRLVEESEHGAGTFKISSLNKAPIGDITDLCDLDLEKSHDKTG